MPAHLVLDLLSGLFLVAAPFLGLVRDDLQGWFWAFGIFEIAAALLTSTRPHLADDEYDTGVVRTGRNTAIAEGDQNTRYGVTNTTYTGSSHTASANQQTLPDDAGWTTANRSAAMGTMGETTETREDADRIEHNRNTINR
jgi:hypothetical protein